MWLSPITNVCGIDCVKNMIKNCLEWKNSRNLYDYQPIIPNQGMVRMEKRENSATEKMNTGGC
jgi:hypothetical protein